MNPSGSGPFVLVVSQVYPPDPASLGQHLQDVAQELVERGAAVRVITSARGYENDAVQYSRYEVRGGVEVRRVPFASLGKRSMLKRLAGAFLFLFRSTLQILAARPDVVLLSTSPPFAPWLSLVCKVLGTPSVVWLMDLNPEQAVEMGVFSDRSLVVRAFRRMNRFAFESATRLMVMDDAMAHRVRVRYGVRSPIMAIPPWPHVIPEIRSSSGAAFRSEHGWEGAFVVMYAGNHSPANPLGTILDAAEVLARDQPEVRFAFVGGGSGKEDVLRRGLTNVSSLPYQPLERLDEVLSAADLHVVTMGDQMLGVVHPCKIYGALAVGRLVVGVAPEGSHIHHLLDGTPNGWWVGHGDVEGVLQAISAARTLDGEARRARAMEIQAGLRTRFSKDVLCPRVCEVVVSAADTAL